MSALSAMKAALLVDTLNLVATATGGIVDANDLGRMGLNRKNPQCAAFDTAGLIKPCIVLKTGVDVPFGDVADDEAQKVGMRATVRLWFYQDNGYATIETMMARAFVLLHGKRLSGPYIVRHAMDGPEQHDIDLDACVRRVDYAATYLRGI